MASLYRRGCVWWVKFYLNGKPVYQSTHTENERVAKSKMRQIELRLDTHTLDLPSRTPVDRFLEDYCKYLASVRTPKSLKNAFSCLRVIFGEACPALRSRQTTQRPVGNQKRRPLNRKPLKIEVTLLEQITSPMISQFITERVHRDGIGAKTANRMREVLHRLFNFAIEEYGYKGADGNAKNPAAAVKKRKVPAHSIRFLTMENIDDQLASLVDHGRLHLAVAILIYAGLRREEMVWLTHGDVDLSRRLIYVRAKTIDGEFWQPKTKVNRVVPISHALADILSSYEPSARKPWYLPSPRGLRWDPDNFSRALRAVNKIRGLDWSSLDFRHTFGSLLAQKGESLFKIAQLMGNSPEICRRHYAVLLPEQMHDVVEFDVAAPKFALPSLASDLRLAE